MNRASLPFFFIYMQLFNLFVKLKTRKMGKQVRQFSETHADIGGSTVCKYSMRQKASLYSSEELGCQYLGMTKFIVHQQCLNPDMSHKSQCIPSAGPTLT